MEQIEVGAYNCQIKKQNSKTQSITFIDQPKFNKNEDFYKAKKIKNKSKNCYKTNELIKLQPRINFIKKLI